MTIQQLISSLAITFRQAYATGTRADPVSIDGDGDISMDDADSQKDGGEVCSSDDDGDEDSDESDEYLNPYTSLSEDGFETSTRKMDPKIAAEINARIRQDLQIIKQAGFKVGVLRGMAADSESSVLSISIRVSKLGISDEVLQAWDLKTEQYVVLLIRYSLGYKTLENIMDIGVEKVTHGVEFRVGLCNRYKPTMSEGMAAFIDVKRGETSKKDDAAHHPDLAGFSSLFISSSLNNFMNTQFLSMMKYRQKFGTNWDGAKLLLNRQEGNSQGIIDEKSFNHLPDEYFGNDIPKDKVLPMIAQTDHLQGTTSSELSFPLIAMQFCMRYFLRCPEFCLICHDKTTETFEALKPYVCSRPLCLFQYMQLGFGPSIEHEIITQPYVVDLLISFCYAAATTCRLRTYPLGQYILVPPKDKSETGRQTSNPEIYYAQPQTRPQSGQVPEQPSRFWSVKFDALKHELIFEDPKVLKEDFNVHEWYEPNPPS